MAYESDHTGLRFQIIVYSTQRFLLRTHFIQTLFILQNVCVKVVYGNYRLLNENGELKNAANLHVYLPVITYTVRPGQVDSQFIIRDI